MAAEAHLEGMEGDEFIRVVQAIDRNVQIIIFTDDDSWETSYKIRVANDPVFYYALKPLDEAVCLC